MEDDCVSEEQNGVDVDVFFLQLKPMQHRYDVRIFCRYIAYYDSGRSLANRQATENLHQENISV